MYISQVCQVLQFIYLTFHIHTLPPPFTSIQTRRKISYSLISTEGRLNLRNHWLEGTKASLPQELFDPNSKI